ncbi:PDZ domain-containing protein [Periweissella cryptocerci]|uniref:endopeptidase La n=1 Tax=Periweissella cryptocerci TaxID=2506420 RepID=A0A4P6YVR0_9LACO|nr:SepM family pheromone-processing serine protease [Periweissella cryptocerci]QBO36888.1 PDZ domain-containing protein [Periweissella cryptocerci]
MKKIIQFKGWIIGAVALVAVLIAFFLPLNSYIETPGGADDLKPFVKVGGKEDQKPGKYMITYVSLRQATPFSLVAARLNPLADVEKAQDVTGGVDNAIYNQVQSFYMQNAINEAVGIAFKTAHRTVHTKYIGIFITSLAENSHFANDLQVGDTVTQVDGHHFDNARGYQMFLAKKSTHDKVTVTYMRNGKTRKTTRHLMDLGGRAGLGISLADNVEVSTTPNVAVNPGSIGGPSGGLMFSLQIYDQLTGGHLRQGRKIAGTGTIDLDGYVGEIGGIDKKIVAAKKAGATIFFAPYVKPTKLNKQIDGGQTNYELAKATAKKYAPKMKVVPVATFEQAIKYLETHK